MKRYIFALMAIITLTATHQAAAQSVYTTPYTFTTLAGLAGQAGSNDGTNTGASFEYAYGIAADSAGNVYVADTYNQSIRKLTPAGVVTTLAGLLGPGNYGTNNGTGSAARFYYPHSVAVDGAGNVYVADTFNQMIRKVTPAGDVTTLAGKAGFQGHNDGMGSAATFLQPSGVAVDSTTNVYVADTANHTIRKVTPAGMVTTLAGLAGSQGTNDGTGNAARFYNPSGMAVDSAGNIYVADEGNNTIRKVTPAGVVTTLAGLAGSQGTNDGMWNTARFYNPFGVAVDSVSNIYVADEGNSTIREVTSSGVVTTLAGLAGGYGFAGSGQFSDGTGSAARFNSPRGVAADSAGNVYVADYYNFVIRKGFMVPKILNSGAGFGFNSGQFGFNLAGAAGQTLVVEASTNLLTWLPIWTNTLGANNIPFSDAQSGTSSSRVYRARIR